MASIGEVLTGIGLLIIGLGLSDKKSNLEHEIEKHIDYLLGNAQYQHNIQEVKRTIVKNILKQLEGMNLTDDQKIRQGKELAKAALFQLGADQTQEYTRNHINLIHQNPPINPAHLKKVSDFQIMNNTNDEMLRKAQQAAKSSRYGVLEEFVGEKLKKKVQFKVEQQFGIHDKQAPSNYREPTPSSYPSYPQPSAPPASSTTTRPTPPIPSKGKGIYPKFSSNRRQQEFFNKFKNGFFTEDECSVCYDSYKEVGERAILFCGHAICPTCLFDLLYVTKNPCCPLCRASINVQEFPTDYLKQHVSEKKLKEAHPGVNLDQLFPKEIYEIYPDFQENERNRGFHAKRERGQIYRENECSICYDSFKDVGKRVTLFCRHSICPTCLFSMLYITENKQCPICKDHIKLDEFSLNHLRKYVNKEQLKESHPNSIHLINQYFSWA